MGHKVPKMQAQGKIKLMVEQISSTIDRHTFLKNVVG